MRALACLGCAALAACFAPDARPLPPPPAGAQTVVLTLESFGEPPQLAFRSVEGAVVLGADTESVRNVGYFAEAPEVFGVEQLSTYVSKVACERARPLPAGGLGAYRWTGTEWAQIDESMIDLYRDFRLLPVDLEDCNRRRGCLARDEQGLEVCRAPCEIAAPVLPTKAACPDGWSAATDTAVCSPPPGAGCATDDCWLTDAPELCLPGTPPPGAQVISSTMALPAVIAGPDVVWLERGRHVGTIRLGAGATLLGECPEDTIVEGKVRVAGAGAIVDGVTIRTEPHLETVIHVDPGLSGVVLRRLFVDGGDSGILVDAGSEVTLKATRIANTSRALVLSGERGGATVVADHLWVLGSPSLGVHVDQSSVHLRDFVLIASMIDPGASLYATEGSTVTLERGYFTAYRPVILTGVAGYAHDVRADGGGLAVHGFEFAQLDDRMTIERLSASRVIETGFWIREQMPAFRTNTRVDDVEVRDSRVGVTVAGNATVRRVLIEGARVSGLELTRKSMSTVEDVTVRHCHEGLRVMLETVPILGSAAISKASFEDGETGGFIVGPLPSLTEVSFTRNTIGIGGDACAALDVLDGERIRFWENAQAVELEP